MKLQSLHFSPVACHRPPYSAQISSSKRCFRITSTYSSILLLLSETQSHSQNKRQNYSYLYCDIYIVIQQTCRKNTQDRMVAGIP